MWNQRVKCTKKWSNDQTNSMITLIDADDAIDWCIQVDWVKCMMLSRWKQKWSQRCFSKNNACARCLTCMCHVQKKKSQLYRFLMTKTVLSDEKIAFEIVKKARNLKRGSQMQMLEVIHLKQFCSDWKCEAMHIEARQSIKIQRYDTFCRCKSTDKYICQCLRFNFKQQKMQID